jgi:RNA polymerase sigma-70 factor (ECF subfamily)
VLERELLEVVIRAIAALPVSQRAVIYLRDVRGLAPAEVSALLSISDGAQRIRLHRARHEVRGAVAAYLAVAPGHAEPPPTTHRSDGSRPAAAR